MKIKSIQFENFRNLPNLDLGLNQDFVILVGGNAAGKTNFLEGMYYASSLRAFPSRKTWDLIHWGKDYFRLTVEADENKLEYYYGRKNEKSYAHSQSINGARKKADEMAGVLPVVSFLPQDLNLLLLSPAPRREYLDEILLQTEPNYSRHLSEYNKVLTQRNELLKRINKGLANAEELEFWDAQLVENAFHIAFFRARLIDSLNKDLPKVYKELTGTKLEFFLNYTSPFKGQEATKQKLTELVRRRRRYDILLNQTTVGPHRDDWQIMDKQNRDLGRLLSRGEQRSVIIALKTQEQLFLEALLNTQPIALLDDLLAELDDGRQYHVLHNLVKGTQRFITTTNLKHIPKNLLGNALVIELGQPQS